MDKMYPYLNQLIFPIIISTPFAVGDVFSYLIKDEKIVLVDCGHRSDMAYAAIEHGLQKQGLKIKDLDEIWLTHGHPDHFGQAVRLADESGALVKGHRKERANFAGNNDRELFRDFFKRHHIAADRINNMLYQLDRLQHYQQPLTPVWISEEDLLTSGKLNFSVKHLPGHAPGHVVYYEDSGLIFGGDVLLEHISTNALINFEPDSGRRNPSLLQYRQSLHWMKTRRGLVLPGHGKQIHNVNAVVTNHLTSQDRRYEKIIQILQQKPFTLVELSHKLFSDALKRDEHFLVFSEVLGYLDWGIQEGSLTTSESEEGIIYEVGNRQIRN